MSNTKIQNKIQFGTVERKVLGLKDISVTARFVYSLLSTYAGNKNICWPSIKELSDVSGLSMRAITYTIAELRDTGIIKTTRKKYYNIYELQDTQQIAQLKESRYATGCVPDTQKPANDTYILIENKQEDKQYTEDFLNFFDEYHKITMKNKTDKLPAFKKWKKLNKAEKIKATEMIRQYYDSVDNKKYIKKARTYLNDKTFNDELRSIETGTTRDDTFASISSR